MSKTYNFGPSFKTSVQNGKTPYCVVENLAAKCRKTPAFVWSNLKKNGFAFSTKFNNKTFWFPTFTCKTSSKNFKKTETTIWPQFIQYALQQGWVTPAQCYNWSNKQLCYHISTCFSKCYSKPGNFNPNTRSNFKTPTGCKGHWATNGTWTSTKATGNNTTGTKTRKFPKTRSRTTGLRLVGATSRTHRTGVRRYGRHAA